VHPRLAHVGLLALPVLGAPVLQQVNNITDKLFASSLEAGRVAALSFANALGQGPRAALLLPLLTPLFPLIARLMSERREAEALAAFRRVAGLLGLLALPMSLLLAIWADEVAQLAFQREACGEECVAQIAPPLVWYALGIWPAFLSLLLNRTLSAGNWQRDILWTTIVTVVLTIVLDVILLGPLEQEGLALAATLGVFANAAMLLSRMRRHFPALSLRALGARQARLLGAAACGAVAALLLDLALPTTDLDSLELAPLLVAKAAIAIAVTVAAARALAGPELAEGAGAVRALVRRRRRSGE
jgi:putative peptidoglycan lipid II flippase